MKSHILYAIFAVLILIFSFSNAFAQEITFGKKAQQTIEISIDEKGTAHVVHKVLGSSSTQQVETYQGVNSNLSVIDRDGNSMQYLTLQKNPIAVVLPPTSKDLVLIKYDLSDVISPKDGVWTWNYSGTEVTSFRFPKGVDMVWVNDRPAYFGDTGIRHHGGSMVLEYVINEPMILKEVEWEGQKFTVGIRTLTNVGAFEFSQSTKSITFDIAKENSLVTTIIPLKLLWRPYDVYLGSNMTLHSEFHNNGTHVWLGFRPHTAGTIQIKGTTVVPEFPIFVPLTIGISLVILVQLRSRFIFR